VNIMLNDKIKIRITSFVYFLLINDALSFEFIKKDASPNINAFMNKLIPNLLDIRKYRREQIRDEIRHFKKAPYYDAIEKISVTMDAVITKAFFSDEFNEPLSEEIWIRPTYKTLTIFKEIYHEETALTALEMSSYIRNLLEEYARLPLYKREHITFKTEYDLLMHARQSDKMISLTYNNIKYDVTVFRGILGFLYEQSNYILCYDNKNNVIKSFILHGIKHPYILNKTAEISDKALLAFEEIIDLHSYIDQETFYIEGYK
jgi:hypothetical protein